MFGPTYASCRSRHHGKNNPPQRNTILGVHFCDAHKTTILRRKNTELHTRDSIVSVLVPPMRLPWWRLLEAAGRPGGVGRADDGAVVGNETPRPMIEYSKANSYLSKSSMPDRPLLHEKRHWPELVKTFPTFSTSIPNMTTVVSRNSPLVRTVAIVATNLLRGR
jgi:hypothetical protein